MQLVICINTRKFLTKARGNKFQKLQISQNEILRMKLYQCFHNSGEVKIYVFGLPALEIVFGVITDNYLHLYSPC